MPSLENLDSRRAQIALATPTKHKAQLGQFMTPSNIASFMASLFSPLDRQEVRLLDPGAGIGSLTAAFLERAVREAPTSLHSETWEIDEKLIGPLRETLDACQYVAGRGGLKFHFDIRPGDFILAFNDLFTPSPTKAYTHAILNPPYKKIKSSSPHRLSLRGNGIETSNLYSAFVALALAGLKDGGELVAITPRSFCNGAYFKPFREFVLAHAAISRVHVFESRTDAFKGDDVLQENIIFHLKKGAPQGPITISSSPDASLRSITSRSVPFNSVVLSGDKQKVIQLPVEQPTPEYEAAKQLYQFRLDELGLAVSTGPIVDFRMRDHLREQPDESTVPLVYAHHFQSGFVTHPLPRAKKPNFICANGATRKWMLEKGNYVLVRRLSSKEEPRRIYPAVCPDFAIAEDFVGFDNHINVFHQSKRGMDFNLAKGLALYLASTFADQWIRQFSGNTQVNAGDLRALRYPSKATLTQWGETYEQTLPSQTVIDKLLESSLASGFSN